MNAVAPLIPCIVSGGSGTRLWPVSRESMPKPFMRLADDQSLLQKTFLRIAGLPDVARLLTVTNRDLLFRTLDDYRAVNRSGLAQDLLLEPMGRNTAPAIAAAALHVQEHFGDQAQLLILPADHLIRDEQAFAAAVAEARGLAAQGYLVTFGITPERAETGFGYIEQGAPLGNGFRVARFVEKPDQATAQSYLDSGKYLWNAGMFCFQAATVLQELERHAPEVLIAELLCTNRYLAERLGAGTALGFERPGPVAAARLRNAPSAQSQPRLDGQSRWRLVSQLTLNHLSLVEGPRALEALREILALHNLRDDASARRQIEGLRQLDCQRVVAHVGEDAWRGWRNGLEIRLRLDPQHFVGASGVLFSAVLAQFFSLYATANRFVRTVLVEADKEVKTWQPQAGSPLSL